MVLGILGLAAMILCWAAGSYWKKVYYLVWLLSLPMPIFGFLYSFSMDEDGDGGSSGRIEAVLMVIILIILVIIYVKTRNLGDAINTFLLMNVYILLMILLSDSDFNRWNRIVRLIVFVATLLISIIAAAATFRAKEYSSVLPSSLLAVAWGRFMLGVFALDYEEIYSSLGLTSLPVTLGLGIILTAAGCLIQLFILKKTDMGKKKRNVISNFLK